MQLATRSLACVALLFASPVGFADEYDDAIATLKRKYDIPALQTLRKGPPVVDQKILAYFDELGRGRGMLPQQQLQTLMSILAERYYSKPDGTPKTMFDKGPGANSALKTVLRLQGRNPVYAGTYFYNRGPQFYTLLLELAKGDDPEAAKAAKAVLRDTADSRRPDGLPGDPALIRLFRRSDDWHMLGVLRDRASIPKMRQAAKSADRKTVMKAISGLSLVPDFHAAPLIIPHLFDQEELDAGKEEGKFGRAYWALRRGVLSQYVPLLVDLARANPGMARAYAVNLIGYFGDKEHVRVLQHYLNDPHPRTREAVRNASLRLQGKLPDPHDHFGWRRHQ